MLETVLGYLGEVQKEMREMREEMRMERSAREEGIGRILHRLERGGGGKKGSRPSCTISSQQQPDGERARCNTSNVCTPRTEGCDGGEGGVPMMSPPGAEANGDISGVPNDAAEMLLTSPTSPTPQAERHQSHSNYSDNYDDYEEEDNNDGERQNETASLVLADPEVMQLLEQDEAFGRILDRLAATQQQMKSDDLNAVKAAKKAKLKFIIHPESRLRSVLPPPVDGRPLPPRHRFCTSPPTPPPPSYCALLVFAEERMCRPRRYGMLACRWCSCSLVPSSLSPSLTRDSSLRSGGMRSTS